MLSSLFFIFLLETVQPSYVMLTSVLPEETVVAAQTSVLTLTEAAAPEKITESTGPVLEAHSAYAIDLKSGTPLFIKNIFSRRPIASITKLVTAMVILDNHDINEKVTVGKNPPLQEGSKMRLAEGEIITVEALLTGLLIASANDAATALAETDAGNEKAFISKMNEKARHLGLKNTHFSNAKGFDEKSNYSTAYDIMLFSREALNYPFIKSTVSIKNTQVASSNGKIKHALESTNELLENPYFKVIGLKTGRTPAAGESFVALAEIENGRQILTAVLDSPDRFKETKILIDWIVRNYKF
ncbi:D-alanyl-D-alanine carboxypeptidase [Candidatus Peregrinibacteria bacterium]|nr:D-alanyl-D-alanine carboxypeptidase [Candidatus Peregrinibacteria bacterium]